VCSDRSNLLTRTLFLGELPQRLALTAFGGGSMVAALALPRLLERVGDRAV